MVKHSRRQLLKSALCFPLMAQALSSTATAAAPTDWETVLANIETFRRNATRLGLSGSWDKPNVPFVINVLPPAGEEAVRTVEREIGSSIPAALRTFYRDMCAGLEVEWLIPGHREVNAMGISKVTYDLLPPEPFRTISDGVSEPELNAGHTRLFLEDVPKLLNYMPQWIANFENMKSLAPDDGAMAVHAERYVAFWKRGFPIGLDLGGNVIAVDRQDEAGRLMWLSHDGAENPGLFIEHTVLEFLAIQSRLGWIGFRGIKFGYFQSEDAGPGKRESHYVKELSQYGDDAPLPATSYVLDDRSEKALIWRKWLGLADAA